MIPSMRVFLTRRSVFASAAGLVLALALSMLALAMAPTAALCDDLRADSIHLSDSAFAILNALTSDSSKTDVADVTGAMASFAGDAQTLSGSLAKGDNDGAAAAMTALITDRRAVDEALLRNPHAIDSSK